MKYLLVMFFAIMLTVSCSKDEPGVNDPALVGTWEMAVIHRNSNQELYTVYTQAFTFNPDFSGNIFGISYDPDDSTNSEVFVDQDFTYTALNSEVVLKAKVNGNPETEIYSYSITGDTLKLRVPNASSPINREIYIKQ